jgi:hypothetical protein
MKVIRIRPANDKGCGGLILKSFAELEDHIGPLQESDELEYLISIEKMSEKDFKKFPEFTGF